MRKPDFCLGENKGADQLRSNCEADQRLCFRYSDSIIPLLFIGKISSLWPASVTVQADLCFVFCFLVTPINQFLIILGRCTLYTPVCLQDEPTYMRKEPV